MRKTVIQPLFFSQANDRERNELNAQMARLTEMYGGLADFLTPVLVGQPIAAHVDAVLFPQLIGAAFSEKEALKNLTLPILVITSEFGTVEMWDWEIVAYLREQLGLTVFSPYNRMLVEVILRALAAKNHMRSGAKFLMFQDSPGEGMQANIFKRFYWWEAECTAQIEKAFGFQIVYRSYQELNQRAAEISDEAAHTILAERKPVCEGLQEGEDRLVKAAKLYLAVKSVIAELSGVEGVGGNCLNESFHSETTPCLAWNWLFEYDHIMWSCEGDTVTLISQYILYSALKRPVMMTNIYPFLVGMAALKHEKIDRFPDIEDADNHALGVHCGYFGFAPESFCSKWLLRPKALEIVNEQALMVDCEFAKGPIALVKIHPDMKTITIIEAVLEDYVQYPGSDCRNGALIRYKNNSGHKVMEGLSSHHAVIVQGDCTHEILAMSKVYDFTCHVL